MLYKTGNPIALTTKYPIVGIPIVLQLFFVLYAMLAAAKSETESETENAA